VRDAYFMQKRGRGSAQVIERTEKKPVSVDRWPRIEAFLDRHAVWLAVALVLIGTARIASTYAVFSHTFDEPAHIACGMEWLQKHTYNYEPQHPPLTRVMAALLPSLAGAHGFNNPSMWDEGLAILFAKGSEDSTLALARAGILPFFWITCLIVFLCGRWIAGPAAAVAAVFFVTMTPTILAHSGLATTDMGLTAMLLMAAYTGWRWLHEPVFWRAAAFGVSTGLAVLAKLSTLPFLPLTFLVALLVAAYFERPSLARVATLVRDRWLQFLVAMLLGAIVIWAGYRFSFGKPIDWTFSLPAPELFSGIDQVKKHSAVGHLTYLLGEVNTTGWPSFYLAALGVKLPLPVLALGIVGLGLLFSGKRFGTRGSIVAGMVLGILGFASLFNRIVLGTRHILPVIVALGIAGGCATVWLLRVLKGRALAQGAVGLMLLALAASSLVAHPNYLGYFNFFAGNKPENFLIDSDLDWGQDTKRLAKRLKELGATEISFRAFLPGDLRKLYGFPVVQPLSVDGPRPGWNVVSLTMLKLGMFGDARYVPDPGVQFWPDRIEPNERVGTSYLLFYAAPPR